MDPTIEKEENSYRWVLKCNAHHLVLITYRYEDIEEHLSRHHPDISLAEPHVE